MITYFEHGVDIGGGGCRREEVNCKLELMISDSKFDSKMTDRIAKRDTSFYMLNIWLSKHGACRNLAPSNVSKIWIQESYRHFLAIISFLAHLDGV